MPSSVDLESDEVHGLCKWVSFVTQAKPRLGQSHGIAQGMPCLIDLEKDACFALVVGTARSVHPTDLEEDDFFSQSGFCLQRAPY